MDEHDSEMMREILIEYGFEDASEAKKEALKVIWGFGLLFLRIALDIVKNRDWAEEVVDTAFDKVFQRLRDFPEERMQTLNAKAYMRTVVTREAVESQ